MTHCSQSKENCNDRDTDADSDFDSDSEEAPIISKSGALEAIREIKRLFLSHSGSDDILRQIQCLERSVFNLNPNQRQTVLTDFFNSQ